MAVTVGALMCAGSIGAAGQGQLEALVKGLESANAGARAKAALSLEEMGPGATAAVPALANALADRDLNVRYCAASALKAVGPAARAAVPNLVKALDTFPGGSPALDGPLRYYADLRVVAAEALGAIGNDAVAAVPALTKALNDPDATVRSTAAGALKRITVR